MKQRLFAVLVALNACAVLLTACASAGKTTPTTDASQAAETPIADASTTETSTPSETETTNPGVVRIEYAEGTVAVESPNAFQERVDQMVEDAQKTIGLQFKNDAYSADGLNFDCYIANPSRNERDMFLAIYADLELTEQVYLSGLVAPGHAFERITLERPLPEGDHTVYVAFSQVEELEGQQTMRAQALVTMDFHVKFPGTESETDGNAALSGSLGAQS